MESKIIDIVKIPYIGDQPRLSEEQVTGYVNQYIANLRKVEQNEPLTNNILGFFELVQNAIRTREKYDHVPEGKGLLVLANDPPEEIDTEAVTFFLKSRIPGSFGQGSINRPKVREFTSHKRSEQQHPEHPNEKLITMGRRFDNEIIFNIYARDDYTALKRVLWFENVMDSFRWYFRIHGIYNVLETGVGNKERVTIGELGLTKYPMSYFVMTEGIYQFGSQELKSVELNVGVGN